jgi:preprotein translocase subunit SecG
MDTILNIIQIVISILLIIVILLQQKGSGLGGAFGGESNVYRSKRGIEKTLYYTTIVLAVLFAAATLFNLFY